MSFVSRKKIGFISFLVILTGIINCAFLCYLGYYVFRGWEINNIIVSLMGFWSVLGNFLAGFAAYHEALHGLYYHVPENLNFWLWMYGLQSGVLSVMIYITYTSYNDADNLTNNFFKLLNVFGWVTELLVLKYGFCNKSFWKDEPLTS